MPELPEVETVRRSLVDRLVQRRVVDLHVGDFPGVVGPLGVEVTRARVMDRQIIGLARRGKYLFAPLDDGASLTIHLRMTGLLRLTDTGAPPLRYQRLALRLDNDNDLRFCDQRKFGRVLLLSDIDVATLDRSLGPEPLSPEFTIEALFSSLTGRAGKIKPLLLDQQVIAGLGNIYVDEALFRARLHPARTAHSVSHEEAICLWSAVREVLNEAIDNRGTTLSSYQDSYGDPGGNQTNLNVYGRGRSGEPCPNCGSSLVCIKVSGRSSHLCPFCQTLDLEKTIPTGAVVG